MRLRLCLALVAAAAGVLFVGFELRTTFRNAQAAGVTLADSWVFVRKPRPSRSADPASVIGEDLERFVPSYLAENGIDGGTVTLIQSGQRSWWKAFGSYGPSGDPVQGTTPFLAGSLSKIVTALLVLRMVDAGLLDLDVGVTRYLGENAIQNEFSAETPITLRALLSHTSGLPGRLPPGREPLAGSPLVEAIEGLRTTYPPGRRFAWFTHLSGERTGEYSSAGYMVVGAVVEQASGLSFEEAARKYVLDPLGMSKSTFRWDATPQAGMLRSMDSTEMMFVAGAGIRPDFSLVTTSHDFSRLLEVVAGRGATSVGTRFLSEGAFSEMLSVNGYVWLVVPNALGQVVRQQSGGPVSMFGGLSDVAPGYVCYVDESFCGLVVLSTRHLEHTFAVLYRALERT